LLVGGSNESAAAQRLEVLLQQGGSGHTINLVGRSSLKQLAALLAEVDLLVTNDSGPMHLAAGLQTPVLGIFTCTSPIRSGPPGDRHELVTTEVPCAASYRKRCPHSGTQRLCCHRELDSDRVWTAFQRLVGKNGLARAA
jgi:ADP-heptose:LPS heptosyltransferase